MIFRLCDRNSNDKISIEEWETFKELFINPYESSCSKTPDYLISESSIAECLNLPVFDIIPKSTSDIENIKELILDALNRADEKKLNFADYIFLRRASFAWKECSVDGKLNKKRMECGLTATTPQKRRFLPISNQVFNIAIQLYQTEKLEQEAFLNFFPFLNIAYMYYFFNEFELPFQDEYLSKKTILKGVEDQILPTSFTAEIVNDIYNSIDGDNLDFMGFASLSYCHKKYKKYLEKDEGKNFSEQSFKNLLKDKELKNLNQIYFDNVKIIDENEYKEFLEINKGGETKLSDKDYFGRFKKINSKNLLKIARMRSNNKINVIFSIFDVNNDKNLKFFYFALFMKLSWAFRGMDTNVDGLNFNEDI